MFFLDQLRQVNEFLAAGNSLLIAIDTNVGKQLSVPVRDGWVFQMATGAIRLAARHQAELIPCSIMDEGPWQFRIQLGRPVPREYLTVEADGMRAGKDLLEELFVHWQTWPEQCSTTLIQRFRMENSVSQASSEERKATLRRLHLVENQCDPHEGNRHGRVQGSSAPPITAQNAKGKA
jgi:hypothetical protein